MTACRARLADGRHHFQHGPIDLILAADGEPGAVDAAIERAWGRFVPLLAELVAELPLLRCCADPARPPAGAVARRMHAAVLPYRPRFVTPMAAVAGSVADAVADCLRAPGIMRAYVNNGGDIALHLTPGAPRFAIGVAAEQSAPGGPLPATLTVAPADPWRGVATSGWRGRSLSLGIADRVTVLAADGACADAAATLIANAVDAGHPSIERRPASRLRDDTDLGERLVTVAVPPLPAAIVDRALEAGAEQARWCVARGLAGAVLLVLQGRWRAVGATARFDTVSPCLAVAA
jgi:ApbE superfamily uncharacterized protein (UPF0280 family)